MKALLLVLLLTSTHAFAKSLKVMQFNAENFFDTSFDEGRDDFTYLPLSLKRSMPQHAPYCETMGGGFYKDQCLNLDWTEAKLNKKIGNLSRVIKSFDSTAQGPDVLVVQEVENLNVLKLLVARGLVGLGYNYIVLIEGDDSRGIDVGIISKFPVVESKRYPIMVNGRKLDTRGITEVTLKVDDKKVIVFGNHWPSQNNPTLERIESAKVLMNAANAKRADLIIAMGDFNTLVKESPSPFSYLPSFIDSESEGRKINSSLNPGTHFYKGEWRSLDKILVHRNSTIKADYKTYQILTPDFMMMRDPKTGAMVPFRSDAATGEGYSDHLPVGLIFNY